MKTTKTATFQTGDHVRVVLTGPHYGGPLTLEGTIRRDLIGNVWLGPVLLGDTSGDVVTVEVLSHEPRWETAQVIRADVAGRGRIVLMRDPRDGSWFTGPGEDDDRAYIFDNDLLSDVSVIVDAAGRVHDDA